jgi:hypothetical protein
MKIPSINVNLKPCNCSNPRPRQIDERLANDHWRTCAASPVLIPCRLPESFSCEVVLGECTRTRSCVTDGKGGVIHSGSCPGRPVRVSASITSPDGSWEKSEVADPDYPEARDRGSDVEARAQAVLRILRMRWGVVKMVVTGQHIGLDDATAGMSPNLFTQRDAVYAALADMARAEEVLSDRANTILKACERAERLPSRDDDDASPSANLLRVFVARLLEQVRVLS